MGKKHHRERAQRRRVKNPVGGEAKDHRVRKGRDRCLTLVGRSHQGRSEAEDTLTTISLGVEISIPGGGADEKDGAREGSCFFFLFFFLFFYIIYPFLRDKKSHGGLAMAKTKLKIQNEQTQETSGTKSLHLGSVPVPGPHTGTKLK